MESKSKIFTSAPLPFMEQKGKFLKQFKPALEKYPADATYVDLFGGSGLLSHTVKRLYSDATVIYNDYGNCRKNYLQNIPKTNQLLNNLRAILKDYPKDQRIIGKVRDQVIDRIYQNDMTGYVDYITISRSILFAMKYALSCEQLCKETLYNVVKQSDYDTTGYLDGLEIVCLCYKELFAKYKDLENVVFFSRSALLINRRRNV